jgi:hypothetical protein
MTKFPALNIYQGFTPAKVHDWQPLREASHIFCSHLPNLQTHRSNGDSLDNMRIAVVSAEKQRLHTVERMSLLVVFGVFDFTAKTYVVRI